MNPAREVKTERFSRTEGKTPAFVDGEVQRLLDVVETSAHTGLRDRALLGVLAYTLDTGTAKGTLWPVPRKRSLRNCHDFSNSL